MATVPDVLATLDSLVELYKIDVTNYYQNATKDRKGNNRSVPRFSFNQLSKKIFDPFSANDLPDLYIQMFDHCDQFCIIRNLRFVGYPPFRQSLLTIRDLILSVIIPYQLPQAGKRKVTDKDNAKKKAKSIQVLPRCTFTIEQAEALFARFLPINLPVDSKMWKQMKFILMRTFKPEDAERFSPIAYECMRKGDISFTALSFIMQDPHINKHLGPEAILHALYIGPLKAQTVEMFASNRPAEFRKQCRNVLATAERAKRDLMNYGGLRPVNIPQRHSAQWNFQDFSRHTSQLIGELKGVKTSHPEINPSWAYSAIKKFGKRTYFDNTYSTECYYDLIWTVLAQRPNMKKFIIETLEKDFHDHEAARFWKKMNPSQMSRHQIKQPSVKEIDLLGDTDDFLNFPKKVQSISVVENAEQLAELKDAMIMKILTQKKIIVGLDAEWSAFNGDSKATILQIAMEDRIFIVDIEAPKLRHEQLREFFSFMFLRKDIIKIGFQFAEDLYQLRNAVTNCRALYQPENVACVGKIIADLLDITEKRPDAEEILSQMCPNFLSNDKANDTIESVEDDKEDKENDTEDEHAEVAVVTIPSTSVESQPVESRSTKVLNKGLSFLCEQVLGRPLDKIEQCSVWDRRPLRPTQIRYAAMDAYCLVMLYEIGTRWALAVNTTIEDLVASQPSPRSSLPLYSDES